jgi:hypothetical protein
MPWLSSWEARTEVERKLHDGEIHIGKPAVQAGQTLTIVDGARYAIEDER